MIRFVIFAFIVTVILFLLVSSIAVASDKSTNNGTINGTIKETIKETIVFHTNDPYGKLTKEEVHTQILAAGIMANDTYSAAFDNSVKSIGYSAFYMDSNIISAIIPDGVTYIDDYNFSYCNQLFNAIISDSVNRIGEYCFGNTKLEQVIIPEYVERIGNSPFVDNMLLKQIIVSPKNRYYASEDGVLFTYDKTALITYPAGRSGAYTIPESVQYISG